MIDTHELRHILSLIQSHLDSHDVDLAELEYGIQSHVECDGDGLDVTGQSVTVEFEYTFDYDERE